MANTYKAWKGAVEPAETGASGNEYQAWKGAVEPVGASATALLADDVESASEVSTPAIGPIAGSGDGGRGLSTNNLAQVDAAHLHEVVLVKLEFDTPVYCHSGIGTITYDGNDYTGVGQFGTITNSTESSELRPSPITLQLSGVDTALIGEALDSGDFGDVVTLYVGYRQDDGTLVDDPWLLWRGYFEYATISQGANNIVSVILQHDLAMLSSKDGGRYTDEDQQSRFTGDIGFKFISDMATTRLLWAGGAVSQGQQTGPGGVPWYKEDFPE